MAHIVKLTRSGSDLYNFQDSSVNVLGEWNPGVLNPHAKVVEDAMVINPRGTTIAAFYDNLNTLFRALADAQDNFEYMQAGQAYTPIFLRFQHDGGANAVQSEVFGGERGDTNNFISGSLRAKFITGLPLKLKRRPYFEETSEQALFSDTVANNNNPAAISGIRGDVPAPLKISVQAGSANQDRIIIGVKAKGTIANFVSRYQAEDYTTRGTGVADAGDSNLNGSSPYGQRWTPPGTTEQELLTWVINTNVADQEGTYRVYVRCRDNNTANVTNTKIRVRAGVTTSTTVWGAYGDSPKYADGSYTGGGAYSAGTTAISLVDCGIIKLSPVDTNGVAPNAYSIQLLGQATASGATKTFDIDEIFLMPTMELPYGGGFQSIKFPADMGNAGNPLGYANANDRVPAGYLDTSGTLQHVAADIRGKPLYAWTNKSMRVFIITQNSSNGRHTAGNTNTVVITATPRYNFSRGT